MSQLAFSIEIYSSGQLNRSRIRFRDLERFRRTRFRSLLEEPSQSALKIESGSKINAMVLTVVHLGPGRDLVEKSPLSDAWVVESGLLNFKFFQVIDKSSKSGFIVLLGWAISLLVFADQT